GGEHLLRDAARGPHQSFGAARAGARAAAAQPAGGARARRAARRRCESRERGAPGGAAPHLRGHQRARQRASRGAALGGRGAARRGALSRVGDGARRPAPPRGGERRAARGSARPGTSRRVRDRARRAERARRRPGRRGSAMGDAARAFLAAGDREGARAVLEQVARDSAAPAEAQALAQAALVQTLIEAGRLDEASQRLAEDGRLSDEDRATLRLRLVRARIAAGDLDRAGAMLARDSSVEALALQGWIALYRGRLKHAWQLFLEAGPYAGDRHDATERSAMLSLLQQVPGDSFPELGAALLTLSRGDSAGAVRSLRLAAGKLPAVEGGGGRAAVLLLAGRVAARLALSQPDTAGALFAEVVRTGGTGAAAPAAELEWARLLERRQQTADAIQHLEHLILSYPESALI